jgi:starch synthase
MNGIDVDSWDPASDKALQKRFSAAKPEGKDACKADLQRASGLAEDPDAAVFGIVSRLAEQKGMDILSEAAEAFLRERVQFVMLADGDAVYRTTFTNIAARHPKNVKVTIGFDNVLARKIYAGSDFFLMPSLFEPCGLGQLISFRYGTLPIVRRTGGLADTVADLDADPKAGNGFVFAERSPEKLLETIRRALRFFADRRKLVAARRRAMKLDYSWAHSAKDYRTFFRSLLTA